MKSRRNDIEKDTERPQRSSLTLDDRHRLRFVPSADAPAALSVAALRYFDDEQAVVPGMTAELPAFIEHARRIDPRFFVSPDALYFILEERDARRRREMLARMSDAALETLVRVPLYPAELAGIRFCFENGLCVIADGSPAGNMATAIGATELFSLRGMAMSALILCPTSLKYHWKREIERITGRTATVIEGTHHGRRNLYSDKALYKIVSYHTFANDARALGRQAFDCVIFDEIQRLPGWNQQVAKSLLHIEAEYCIALSGSGAAGIPEGIFSGCKVLSRGSDEIESRLPGRRDTLLPVPMTREQQEIHSQAFAEAARLTNLWRCGRYLSEKERRRLLLELNRMQCVSDSTFLIDRTDRHDTKIGEALEIIKSVPGRKTVVFSRWTRMLRLLGDELTRAGIACSYRPDNDTPVVLCSDGGVDSVSEVRADLIINLDLPPNPAAIEQRIGRVYRPEAGRRVRVITMISAGSVEEKVMDAVHAGTEVILPESSDILVTVDDRCLDRLAELFCEASAGVAPADCDVVGDAMRFLHSLSDTLASPEKTERLLDRIVVESPETGGAELRVPVESRDRVAEILYNLSNIFGAPKR